MCWDKNRPPRGAYQAGRYLPQASPLCKLASPAKSIKSALLRAEIGRFVPKSPILARFGSRKIPANRAVGRRSEFGQIWRLRCRGRPHTLLSPDNSVASCGRPCDGFDNERRDRQEASG